MKKKIIGVFLIFLLSLVGIKLYVNADVGDFETYDSWDSSDYDYDYDDDDDDYSYSYGSSSSSGSPATPVEAIFIIVLVLGFMTFSFVFLGKHVLMDLNRTVNSNNLRNANTTRVVNTTVTPLVNEEEITQKIIAIDENFNLEEFKSWCRDLFIKLQYAWSDRDWSAIRYFETNQLFEQHSTQLQRYIQNKQINVLQGVSVNSVKLLKFEQTEDQDILSVVLNSKMIDYIIDEETRNIIKGNSSEYHFNSYKLVFVRKKGVKTKIGESTVNTTNCPNCGAPTKITSSGQCEYCGSIITTGEFNWVLSSLERV